MISLVRTDSKHPHFRELIALLDKDLQARYSSRQTEYDQYNHIDFIETVIIAYKDSIPVGCACFKLVDTGSVELKRMYVKPGHRGEGIASTILRGLEDWALENGNVAMILETGNKQPEAVTLYTKAGYFVTENYGPYRDLPDSICMKKTLK